MADILPQRSIDQAEIFRTQGKLTKVVKMVGGVRQVTGEQISDLSSKEMFCLEQQARITVVALLGLANRSLTAKGAVDRLREAKEVIQGVYQNGKVQDDLKDRRPLESEMLRDIAHYWLCVSRLTGEERAAERAVGILGQIIETKEESTAQRLAEFELARLKRKQQPSQQEYEELKGIGGILVDKLLKEENWERLATVASWVVIDGVRAKDPRVVMEGLRGWLMAGQHEPRTRGILVRQVAKEVTEGIRTKMWRNTRRSEENYKELLELA